MCANTHLHVRLCVYLYSTHISRKKNKMFKHCELHDSIYWTETQFKNVAAFFLIVTKIEVSSGAYVHTYMIFRDLYKKTEIGRKSELKTNE